MSNVVTLDRTHAYFVSRAGRHRRAGRYDEAMTLLWKAKNQFGLKDEIEWEMARVYEEMDCTEEAARSYLRVMRIDGEHRAHALFQLALLRAQQGDTVRAQSYLERIDPDAQGVSKEMIRALGDQLREESKAPSWQSKKGRAKTLIHRAAHRLNEGKASAAYYLLTHAIALHESAQGYTMLACCQLLRMHYDEAVDAAQRAHALSPGKVQTLCVLADAHFAAGDAPQGKRALYLAAMRAKDPDDLFITALESAKYGDDALTLRLTNTLLRRQPYHTQAMRLRACALVNRGKTKAASRLFGRLRGLLPEDTVCESLYRLACEGVAPTQRLSLGADVTREEGIDRAAALAEQLSVPPQTLCEDSAQLSRVCRLCDWAFHSPMAGGHVKMAALMLLGALAAQEAKDVLLDALTDTQLHDSVKLSILRVLGTKDGFGLYDADIGGRLVRCVAMKEEQPSAIGGDSHEMH